MFILSKACMAQCSNLIADGIPQPIVGLIGALVFGIKVVVPILLVIFGMLDLGKAVMAQKEDEIKKGQQTFMKRLIAAAIVFLVIFIAQLVIGIVSGQTGEGSNVWNCADCILSGDKTNTSRDD